uniref:DUF4839 domain-containing protein n=1 Tax=Anaerococcus mediterraneensis TaxID=1870984 RepID=UPI0009315705|nr:DUF4839 domain-containing protein [Anaerococcus mediterraneensis]
MKCENCGKKNDNDAKYCKYCGSELKKDKLFDISKRLEDLEKIKRKLKLEEKIETFINQEKKISKDSNEKSTSKKLDDHDYANNKDKFDEKKENSKENNFLSNLTSKFPISYKLIGILLIAMLILGPIFSKLGSKQDEDYDYENPVAIDVKSYDTTIKVKSSVNLIFSTYDIKICVDGEDQTVIKNGEETEFTLKLEEGSHNLKISKASDESIFGEVNFNVNNDNKLQFIAQSHSDNIEIQSEDYEEKVIEEAKEESPSQSPENDIDKTTENIGEDIELSEISPALENTEEQKDDEEEVITVDNNEDFRNLMVPIDDLDPRIKEFSDKYYKKTIEFDGIVADIQNHSTMYGKVYKTRYDVLIYGGDGFESTFGPSFRFTNIYMGELPSITSSGYPVKIKAEVGSYNEKNGLFELYPISIETR